MEGGYQIIDFKKRLVGSIYNSGFGDIFTAIDATNKVLLVQNLVIDDNDSPVEVRDFFCTPKELAGGFLLICESMNIIVHVDGTYGIARWYPYYDQGFDFVANGSLTLNINDTLEFDENGALGVASK